MRKKMYLKVKEHTHYFEFNGWHMLLNEVVCRCK